MISILTTDIHLNINSWDQQLALMTGLATHQVEGRSLTSLIPDFETSGLGSYFEQVLKTGKQILLPRDQFAYLLPCPPPHPSAYFAQMQQEVMLLPLYQGERVTGMVVVIEDVTARCEDTQAIDDLFSPTGDSSVLKKLLTLPLLIPNLQHQDWRVRQQAIAQLQDYDEPQLVDTLVELMRQHHRNPNFLNAILQTLSLSVVNPLPALSQCIHDPDTDLRIYVALALGERQDPQAVDYLLEMLKDPDINVRFHAIEGLGRLKAKTAVEPLLAIAQSEEFYLSFAALDALLQIGDSAITPRLVPLIHNSLDWRVRREAIENLALDSDVDLLEELWGLMQRHHQNPAILNSILQVLVLAEIDCLPFLRRGLSNSDPNLRIYSLLALAERQDRQAIADILPLLSDPDSNVRFHACEALGLLQAIEAIPPLIDIALSGDFFLAFPAMEALLRIGSSRQGSNLAALIAQDLAPLLRDDLLQDQAIALMEALGDTSVVEPLSHILNTVPSAVEAIAQAVMAIAQRYRHNLGANYLITSDISRTIDATGKQHLLAGLKQVSPDNLEALVFVLGCLKGKEVETALSELLENPRVRHQVVDILVGYGVQVQDLLLAQLESPHIETRKAAIIALGRIGSAQSVHALTQLLEAEHPELVKVTTEALAKIGDHQAFESLIGLLGHADVAVRLGAIAALNSLGHPETATYMYDLLEDDNDYRRESAIKIVGYFAYPNCLERLLARVQDKSEKIRRITVETLAYLDETHVLPLLITTLHQDTPAVRAAAAHALGELDDFAALGDLLIALDDPELWVRYQSLRAIDQLLRSPLHRHQLTTLPPALRLKIMALAEHDNALQVQAAAIECLGNFPDNEVLNRLAMLTENPLADLVRAALRALAKMSDPRAIVPLLKCLNSPSPQRRLDTIHAFHERECENHEAQMTLEWIAIADPNLEVAQAAIYSLQRLCTPEAIAALLHLSTDPRSRDTCIDALAEYHDAFNLTKTDYIETIAQHLNHAQSAVRLNVVEILKRLEHPRASEHLISALNDQDTAVRLAALEALIFLGNRHAQEQMRLLARTDASPAIRRLARKGLAQ